MGFGICDTIRNDKSLRRFGNNLKYALRHTTTNATTGLLRRDPILNCYYFHLCLG